MIKMFPLILAIACLLPTSLEAVVVDQAKPYAIQVHKNLTIDLRPFAKNLGIADLLADNPDWVVESSAGLQAVKINAHTVRLKATRRGPLQAVVKADPADAEGVAIDLIGYELDRSKVLYPDVLNHPRHYDPEEPTPLRATLRMVPYVEGVHFTFQMFAHTTTFEGGDRKFTVVTGDKKTSLGDKGFIVKRDKDTGESVGVFSFTMMNPDDERSFCLRTSQKHLFEDDDVVVVQSDDG